MAVNSRNPEGASLGAKVLPPQGDGGRRTLALLFDYMDYSGVSYEHELRAAFQAKCEAFDLNLLLVYGWGVQEERPGSAAQNAVYDLVGSDAVDGVIAVSASLARRRGEQHLAQWFRRWEEFPRCSIGVAVPGTPSVLLENLRAMEELVEHVVGEHERRRVAFIAGPQGNPESDLRFEAYRRVLERFKLPFDPKLVAIGDFFDSGGKRAMEEILARGSDVDAVVAANDAMAFGAVEALRAWGLRVPREIPVSGFDDLPRARLGNPPLTTVGQPFEAIAEAALKLVLEQCDGREVPSVLQVPMELRIRKSCGCGLPHPGEIVASATSPSPNISEFVREEARFIRFQLMTRSDAASAEFAEYCDRLLEALSVELEGNRDFLIRTVEDMLDAFGKESQHYRVLEEAIDFLRAQLREAGSPALADLWFEAYSTVVQAHSAVRVEHNVRIDDDYARLLLTLEQLSVAVDVTSLHAALVQSLPSMGIQNAHISRFVDESRRELEVFVSLVDGRPAEMQARRFPARQLMPPGGIRDEQRYTSILVPLTFEERLLGVVVFEYTEGAGGYLALREQLSAALIGIELHEEVVRKTMLHERSVQERRSTARRMQALSVLAGGVAHDLNNALGPLVALPDIILRQMDDADVSGELGELRADIESIRGASLRATQTIKDLLTLSRQGRTAKEPLDVRRAVTRGLAGEPLRRIQEINRLARVVFEFPAEPLTILASEGHFVRAINNLIRNAVEALEGPGKIVVRGKQAKVSEPISGYEVITPGLYVAITVADTGSGIPEAEIGRVFEPFFSMKRLGENSGTGLGLAIVHGVVKEHEGFVDVQSSAQDGTTFTLYFPSVEQSAKVSERPAGVPQGRGRILVVDDEPVQLRTTRRVLKYLGYEVETLTSGQQACELFEQSSSSGGSSFDLVILDMILNEGQDGLEVCERIQKVLPHQKVILSSGHAPTERVELAVDRGLQWLVKPFTTEALAQAVHQTLAGAPSPRISVPHRPGLPG